MLEELKDFVDIKEGQEEAFADYLQGKMMSPEGVKGFLDTPEGRKVLQPILDRYHNKGLESWKQNNLDLIVEEEVSKRNPAETDEQKRIRKLEQKLAESESQNKRTRLEAQAAQMATTKGIPSELVPFLVGSDEDSTETNIDTFSRIITDVVQSQVKSRFKDTGRNVPATRQAAAGELESLKKELKTAVEQNKPLNERIRLEMTIQDLERQE